MDAADCPYLARETLACRASLDLSRDAPMRVAVSWHCRHPFHGIMLELGTDHEDVCRTCAACTLPRPLADAQRRMRDVIAHDERAQRHSPPG